MILYFYSFDEIEGISINAQKVDECVNNITGETFFEFYKENYGLITIYKYNLEIWDFTHGFISLSSKKVKKFISQYLHYIDGEISGLEDKIVRLKYVRERLEKTYNTRIKPKVTIKEE